MKKIIWISSYLPRAGGIAYYSFHYINYLKKYAKKTKKKTCFKIIAHTDAKLADYSIIDNIKDKNWHLKVLKIIKKEKPSIVHIQHEYGLYETYKDRNRRVIELIKLIRNEKIPVVMTYHSVYKKLESDFAKFTKESLEVLSAGIFHEQYQKDSLKQNIGYIPDNIFILPHGSRDDIKLNKKELRKDYDYKGKLIVGSAGLADERKGYRTLIKQWSKVAKRFPNAILSLELKPHFNPVTRIYIDKVLETILQSPVSDNIEFIIKNYSEMEFYKRLGSFDILVLPYKSESQSGVLAHGFATGTPAIVTDIEGLGAEIRNSKAGIAVKKRENFWKAINKLLANPKLRNQMSKNALNYVKKVSSWNIIARKTFQIYGRYW